MEVEVKFRRWPEGKDTRSPLTSTRPGYPVCAPPQGADPCSNFKWLLRREGRLPSDSSQHQDDKDQDLPLCEPPDGCGGRSSKSEATVREIN